MGLWRSISDWFNTPKPDNRKDWASGKLGDASPKEGGGPSYWAGDPEARARDIAAGQEWIRQWESGGRPADE